MDEVDMDGWIGLWIIRYKSEWKQFISIVGLWWYNYGDEIWKLQMGIFFF